MKTNKLKFYWCFFVSLIFVYLISATIDQIYSIGSVANDAQEETLINGVYELISKLPNYKVISLSGLFIAIVLGICIGNILYKIGRMTSIFNKVNLVQLTYAISYGVVFVSHRGIISNYDSYGFEGFDFSFLYRFLIFILAAVGFVGIRIISTDSWILKVEQGVQKVALGIVSGLVTFMLVGRTLFMPIDNAWSISVKNISVYIFAVYMIGIIIIELVLIFNRVNISSVDNYSMSYKRKAIILTLLLDSIILLFYFISVFPGVLTEDSMDALREIAVTHHYTNGFPAFIKVFYDAILPDSFTPTTSAVAIVLAQMILYLIFMASFSSFLLDIRISSKFVIGLNVISTALPTVGLFIMMFGSNYYFVICMCWITFMLGKIINSRGKELNIKNVIILMIAMTGLYFSRGEAIITYFVLSIVLVVMGAYFRKIWLLAPVFISMIGVLLIKGPVYDAARVEKIIGGVGYAEFVSSDIVAATCYYGGIIPDDVSKLLDEYGGEEEFAKAYRQDHFDSLELSISQLTSSGKSFSVFKRLLESGNLGIIIRARLDKSDIVWDVTEPVGYHSGRLSTYIADNDYGISRKGNILTLLVTKVIYPLTLVFPFFDMLFYRGGIIVAFSLIIFLYAVLSKKIYYVIYILPAWAHVITLMGCLEWALTRHILGIFFPIIIGSIMIIVDQNGMYDKR